MRKRRLFGVLIFGIPAVLAVATIAVAGDGGTRNFRSDTLTGYQEATTLGPISTTGTGTFEASLNNAGDTIVNDYTTGSGAGTQAHTHCRRVSGGLIAFLCGGARSRGRPYPDSHWHDHMADSRVRTGRLEAVLSLRRARSQGGMVYGRANDSGPLRSAGR